MQNDSLEIGDPTVVPAAPDAAVAGNDALLTISRKFGVPRGSPLRSGTWRQAALISGLLVLAVGLVFGQVVGHGFVNFDDELYVCENPLVNKGLTAEGIAAAFEDHPYYHWQPLAPLSHMLDCQLYGLKPAGHHVTSVLLHAAAAVALFLMLRSMTGDLWPSALAAAVFAIHPLRAESVAWISERKDVLSALFFVLSLGAYVHSRGARPGSATCC